MLRASRDWAIIARPRHFPLKGAVHGTMSEKSILCGVAGVLGTRCTVDGVFGIRPVTEVLGRGLGPGVSTLIAGGAMPIVCACDAG
eukprot:909161-Amphidinium_carterae.1